MTAAMEVTLHELKWRTYSTKTVVVVADAPPHGEFGCGFYGEKVADMGVDRSWRVWRWYVLRGLRIVVSADLLR